MIYNFDVPTIEDNVDFPSLIKKLGQPEWKQEIDDFFELRKRFKYNVNDLYLKNKQFGE